ncbi:hypothetical protein FRC17_000940, partial [Serendipita sp. 399]
MDSILQMLGSLNEDGDSYTDLLNDLLFFGPGGMQLNDRTGGGSGQPIPESEIDKRVKQAINACRPEARN